MCVCVCVIVNEQNLKLLNKGIPCSIFSRQMVLLFSTCHLSEIIFKTQTEKFKLTSNTHTANMDRNCIGSMHPLLRRMQKKSNEI